MTSHYELWIDGRYIASYDLVTDMLQIIQMYVDGEYDTRDEQPFALSFDKIEIRRVPDHLRGAS